MSEKTNRKLYEDFYALTEDNKDLILEHVKEYQINKNHYTREYKQLQLTSRDLETIIRLRNGTIPKEAIANSLRIHVTSLGQLLKSAGYHWDISTKSYILRSSSPKKIKKGLIEPSRIQKLILDPMVYRLIAIQAHSQRASFDQIISNAVVASSSKELLELARRPSHDLKFHRIKRHIIS